MSTAFECRPEQLTRVDEEHYMVAEASELGLPAGVWPPVLRVGYDLYGLKDIERDSAGQVTAAVYHNLRPSADHMSIRVFND